MLRTSVQICLLFVATTLCAAFDSELLFGQSSATQGNANEVRAACAQDVQKLCANVQPGGGRIIACLRQHQDQVSDACKQAVAKATQQPNSGAGSAPATSTPPAGAQSASSPAPNQLAAKPQKIVSLRRQPTPPHRATTF